MLEFKFPDIGEGITEGKLLKWMVKAGDKVNEGDSLFLVETDKVNAEIPSPAAGVISETFGSEGDIIYVGNVIVRIDTGDGCGSKGTKPAGNNEEEEAGVVGELEVSSEVIGASQEGQQVQVDTSRKILATPAARKLAKDLDINISTIKGSGPAGRVMKEDIFAAGKKNKFAAADQVLVQNTYTDTEVASTAVKMPELKFSGEVERIPLTTMRKTISKNMALSKALVPHAAVVHEIDVTKLVQFRSENNALAEGAGVHLTYMPFIIKALTLTLKEFPILNSSYDMDKEELILKKYYNIGIAVDTPEGLMVPIVKDADKKGLLDIAKEVVSLSSGARNRTVQLDKLQNGTITITNYGAVGAVSGIPIIRYPEVAILGVGGIRKKPVVDENGDIAVRSIMNMTLCFDHRIVDGGEAGRFLSRLREYLENPLLLLLN
jgi:pyruvate dehydrogenase E2 component (dihydrolipoamide acetyltransferase)